jgi:uncharacterized protein (TIGR00299 family) protein
MLTALFDIFTGISGDMTIGALIAAGADFDHLKNEINKLGLKGFELKISHVKRNAIDAIKFDVVINNPPEYHTHLTEILKMIDGSRLSGYVKTYSRKIFELIGTEEAKIHSIPIEKIHFHEVGAIDSIIDIIGTCVCLENLGVEQVYTTPVKMGRGLINTQHGVMPDPAPATLEILKDYPIEFTDIDFELTTPTGAAIVRILSKGIYNNGLLGSVNIKKIGFGSGTFDIKESPNLLRVILSEVQENLTIQKETLLQLETNIDDMNPQLYPYVTEKLLETGVLDVFYHDIIMKKGRPGILLSVLIDEKLLNKVLGIIYNETTTLGVRIKKLDRHKLPREVIELDSSFGKVKAKVIESGEESLKIKKIIPEFEECKRIALSTGKTYNAVYEQLIKELNK